MNDLAGDSTCTTDSSSVSASLSYVETDTSTIATNDSIAILSPTTMEMSASEKNDETTLPMPTTPSKVKKDGVDVHRKRKSRSSASSTSPKEKKSEKKRSSKNKRHSTKEHNSSRKREKESSLKSSKDIKKSPKQGSRESTSSRSSARKSVSSSRKRVEENNNKSKQESSLLDKKDSRNRKSDTSKASTNGDNASKSPSSTKRTRKRNTSRKSSEKPKKSKDTKDHNNLQTLSTNESTSTRSVSASNSTITSLEADSANKIEVSKNSSAEFCASETNETNNLIDDNNIDMQNLSSTENIKENNAIQMDADKNKNDRDESNPQHSQSSTTEQSSKSSSRRKSDTKKLGNDSIVDLQSVSSSPSSRKRTSDDGKTRNSSGTKDVKQEKLKRASKKEEKRKSNKSKKKKEHSHSRAKRHHKSINDSPTSCSSQTKTISGTTVGSSISTLDDAEHNSNNPLNQSVLEFDNKNKIRRAERRGSGSSQGSNNSLNINDLLNDGVVEFTKSGDRRSNSTFDNKNRREYERNRRSSSNRVRRRRSNIRNRNENNLVERFSQSASCLEMQSHNGLLSRGNKQENLNSSMVLQLGQNSPTSTHSTPLLLQNLLNDSHYDSDSTGITYRTKKSAKSLPIRLASHEVQRNHPTRSSSLQLQRRSHVGFPQRPKRSLSSQSSRGKQRMTFPRVTDDDIDTRIETLRKPAHHFNQALKKEGLKDRMSLQGYLYNKNSYDNDHDDNNHDDDGNSFAGCTGVQSVGMHAHISPSSVEEKNFNNFSASQPITSAELAQVDSDNFDAFCFKNENSTILHNPNDKLRASNKGSLCFTESNEVSNYETTSIFNELNDVKESLLEAEFSYFAGLRIRSCMTQSNFPKSTHPDFVVKQFRQFFPKYTNNNNNNADDITFTDADIKAALSEWNDKFTKAPLNDDGEYTGICCIGGITSYSNENKIDDDSVLGLTEAFRAIDTGRIQNDFIDASWHMLHQSSHRKLMPVKGPMRSASISSIDETVEELAINKHNSDEKLSHFIETQDEASKRNILESSAQSCFASTLEEHVDNYLPPDSPAAKSCFQFDLYSANKLSGQEHDQSISFKIPFEVDKTPQVHHSSKGLPSAGNKPNSLEMECLENYRDTNMIKKLDASKYCHTRKASNHSKRLQDSNGSLYDSNSSLCDSEENTYNSEGSLNDNKDCLSSHSNSQADGQSTPRGRRSHHHLHDSTKRSSSNRKHSRRQKSRHRKIDNENQMEPMVRPISSSITTNDSKEAKISSKHGKSQKSPVSSPSQSPSRRQKRRMGLDEMLTGHYSQKKILQGQLDCNLSTSSLRSEALSAPTLTTSSLTLSSGKDIFIRDDKSLGCDSLGDSFSRLNLNEFLVSVKTENSQSDLQLSKSSLMSHSQNVEEAETINERESTIPAAIPTSSDVEEINTPSTITDTPSTSISTAPSAALPAASSAAPSSPVRLQSNSSAKTQEEDVDMVFESKLSDDDMPKYSDGPPKERCMNMLKRLLCKIH